MCGGGGGGYQEHRGQVLTQVGDVTLAEPRKQCRPRSESSAGVSQGKEQKRELL